MSDERPPRHRASFDHWSEEFVADRHRVWADLRTRCPVAHNELYGGFWVASGYEAVASVARDEETFSSAFYEESRDGIDYIGSLTIPRTPGIPKSLIGESTGIVHQSLRRAVNPYMLPPAVERLRPWISEVAAWFIDQKVDAGAMDLVLDYTNPVPAIATLRILGLPGDDWETYSAVFHAIPATAPGSPEHDVALAKLPDLMKGLVELARRRRAEPRDDLMSDLARLRIDDEELDDAQMTAVLWNLVSGGLETTGALTSLALHHLGSHPDQRQQLVDDASCLIPATEEFLRYFTPVETLTRTVTRDVCLAGQNLERGEHVLVSWLSADRDESEFPNADEVILDRTPNAHLAFGVGAHRCIGMHLARAVFQILVSVVLERIPDYVVDEPRTRTYANNLVSGVARMPVTFTARPRPPARDRPF